MGNLLLLNESNKESGIFILTALMVRFMWERAIDMHHDIKLFDLVIEGKYNPYVPWPDFQPQHIPELSKYAHDFREILKLL